MIKDRYSLSSVVKLLVALLILFSNTGTEAIFANEPDSACILAYSSLKNESRNGLHFAWSLDKKVWHKIGPEHSFLRSDYGNWSTEKKMYDPFLYRDSHNLWHCLWSLNEKDGVLAISSSKDLIHWEVQSYPTVISGNNCIIPGLSQSSDGVYLLSWLSTLSGDSVFYETKTMDFTDFSERKIVSEKETPTKRSRFILNGEEITGTVHKVAWEELQRLISAQKTDNYYRQLTQEYFPYDPVHLKDVQPVDANIQIELSNRKKISDKLIGIFFEDINYAADGGLYAELIQNRSFEYDLMDRKGSDSTWISTKSWSLTDSGNSSLVIDTLDPVHPNNPHYALFRAQKPGAGLLNEGFAGIPVKNGEKYDFSIFTRSETGKSGKLLIQLVDPQNQIIGSTEVLTGTQLWSKSEAVLIAEKTENNARLKIVNPEKAEIALDMVSLFPQETFRGRKNGLRKDLAQFIADIQPRFVRFPGGCVVHGDGLENIYRWKNTIGPPETRKSDRNIWGYHQSFGLGFYEYFQFCEDIGAEPIPVIAAGVPCQNSSTGGAGQQGGVPLCEMDSFIQDILDLIEYCNGDTDTEWGSKRALAGHPEAFNLKYLGIGNEDLISDIFKERFEMIFRAIKKEYPEITVIGTVGPFHEGSDYEEGWEFATELNLKMVDEHYYEQPGWFIHNQDFYDRYDRNKAKVYLGEYASRGNSHYNALAEAIYLLSIERNADVVSMASYAPLLAKEGFTQWGTDLIFFSNTGISPTPNYEVQKLFGQNWGDEFIANYIELAENDERIHKKIASSVVFNSKSNKLIIKMVNLLPVEVNADIILDEWGKTEREGTQIILAGKPNDLSTSPEYKNITFKNGMQVTLPEFSLVIIELPYLK